MVAAETEPAVAAELEAVGAAEVVVVDEVEVEAEVVAEPEAQLEPEVAVEVEVVAAILPSALLEAEVNAEAEVVTAAPIPNSEDFTLQPDQSRLQDFPDAPGPTPFDPSSKASDHTPPARSSVQLEETTPDPATPNPPPPS